MINTLHDIFRNTTHFTSGQLHHTCPKHKTKTAYLHFVTSKEIVKALDESALLQPLLLFLNDYNWSRRNFCYSVRGLQKKWRMGHEKIKKILLCFYFLGIIDAYGKWTFSTPKGTGYVPVWILTDKLFSSSPETLKKGSQNFVFRRARSI